MRDKALSFIRTAFALADGGLDKVMSQETIAANALAAFLAAPVLASKGLLNESDYDFEDREDYKVLLQHAMETEVDEAAEYVGTLDDAAVAQIVASSQMFFSTVVNETQIIPMADTERTLLKAMIERECSSVLPN